MKEQWISGEVYTPGFLFLMKKYAWFSDRLFSKPMKILLNSFVKENIKLFKNL